MSYSGLFIRHAIGATPSTNTGAWTDSPDIIPWGTAPYPQPSDFTTDANYDNGYYDHHTDFYIKQPNYVYVRAKNVATAAQPGRFWFYYTPSSVVTWPQKWLDAKITVDGQTTNHIDVSASSANQIIVNTTPFVVVPDPPPVGDHFCLIAFAENGQSEPPMSPKPEGAMPTWDDLANYVLNHPNMGWRNVTPVSSGAATWTESTPLSGAPAGGQFNVGVECKDMPTDGSVSFAVQGPDAKGTVNKPNMPITDPNMRFTVPITWPAGYSSSIEITYTKGATPPPAGAYITPAVDYSTETLFQALVGSGDMNPFLLTRLVHGSRTVPVLHPQKDALLGISIMYMVGSLPYRFDGKS